MEATGQGCTLEPLNESLAQLREIFLYRHKLVGQRVAMELRKEDKSQSNKSKAISFINRKSKHLIAEINKTIAECDKAIDSIIEADEELKENYAIITSIKGVARQNATCMLVYTNNFKNSDMTQERLHAIMELPLW